MKPFCNIFPDFPAGIVSNATPSTLMSGIIFGLYISSAFKAKSLKYNVELTGGGGRMALAVGYSDWFSLLAVHVQS